MMKGKRKKGGEWEHEIEKKPPKGTFQKKVADGVTGKIGGKNLERGRATGGEKKHLVAEPQEGGKEEGGTRH